MTPAGGEHRPVAVPVGAKPPARHNGLSIVDDFDRRRPLVRIHPDDDAPHAFLLDVTDRVQRPGCRPRRTGKAYGRSNLKRLPEQRLEGVATALCVGMCGAQDLLADLQYATVLAFGLAVAAEPL
jgi:hypothetical protein